MPKLVTKITSLITLIIGVILILFLVIMTIKNILEGEKIDLDLIIGLLVVGSLGVIMIINNINWNAYDDEDEGSDLEEYNVLDEYELK